VPRGSQHRRGNKRGFPLLVGFAASLCLLGQFSGVAHNLLVQHATCAEHGEIIHTAGDHTSAVGAGVDIAAEARVAGSDAAESAEDHGHDHCLAAAHRRGHVGLKAVHAAVTADSAPKAIVAVEVGARESVSCALYRLAPKNSPPA